MPTGSRDQKLWPGSFVLQLLVVTVTYYVAARLSLRASLVGGVVTPIWPPTGIAFVALLVYRYRIWPAVTAAALFVNVPLTESLGAAALISIGNTLAPIAAVALLRAAEFRRELERVRDALLVVVGALLAMTISATFGTVALRVDGTITSGAMANTWSVWWAGDATGILVFAPFLLSIRGPGTRSWRARSEAIVLMVGLAVVVSLVFRREPETAYLVFPFLIWAATRFGQLGASLATLLVVTIAVWAAVDEVGLFANQTLLHRMLTLQVLNAVTALTSFVLAAIMTERTRALADVRDVLEHEHRITETLQRSLLPERLPEIPGVTLAARYLPGGAGLAVGGDWYDVFLLPNGRVALTIGDVVGRGVGAAAAMGQLRSALRAYALDNGSPGAVIERLSRLVHEFESAQMATLVYAVLDPDTGAFAYANAGHPPPLVAGPGPTARFLDDGRSPPLGVWHGTVVDAEAVLEPGTTLLLYTDGLVESRSESIEVSLESFREAVAGHDGDLASLCDGRILGRPRPATTGDDVALLALRLTPLPLDHFTLVYPAEPQVIAAVRQAVGRWLDNLAAEREERDEIVLACDEAATNVLEHAYGHGGGLLEVDARCNQREVCIVVRDRGEWRPPRDDSYGRGFRLMDALVDSVEVVRTPDGTEVQLRRTLGHPTRPITGPATPAETAPERPGRGMAVAHLDGDIDFATAATRFSQLTALVAKDQAGLIVDLSGVHHLDSAGIRLLYQLAAWLDARRQRLAVVAPAGTAVRRILGLSDFERSVTVFETVPAAQAHARSEHG